MSDTERKLRIPEQLRRQVRERAQGRCEYCLLHDEDVYLRHQTDHIIAEKHGGATTLDNLAWPVSIATTTRELISPRWTPLLGVSRYYFSRADRSGIGISASLATVSSLSRQRTNHRSHLPIQ